MTEIEPTATRIAVGPDDDARTIAMLQRAGSGPGLFWLGGYRSDMRGTKAAFLDQFAADRGLAMTRFDYSGHGESSGRFEDGTISQWLADTQAAFSRTDGPQIIVGSSMGGWLALLLAQSLAARGDSDRLAGMVLIAPAFDMTKLLMWDAMSKTVRQELDANGIYFEPNPYGDPTPITKALIEDGKTHLFGDRLISAGCPVHILQGMEDREVPHSHAAALAEKLASDDAMLTLVKDGDHRLSRPEDLALLGRTIEAMRDAD